MRILTLFLILGIRFGAFLAQFWWVTLGTTSRLVSSVFALPTSCTSTCPDVWLAMQMASKIQKNKVPHQEKTRTESQECINIGQQLKIPGLLLVGLKYFLYLVAPFCCFSQVGTTQKTEVKNKQKHSRSRQKKITFPFQVS